MNFSEKLALLVCVGSTTAFGLGAASNELQKLNRVVAAVPSSELYFARAVENSKRGKHTEAIVDLDRALQLKPDDYRFLMTKAFELNRLARFAESDQVRNLALSKVAATAQFNWPERVLQEFNRKKICLKK